MVKYVAYGRYSRMYPQLCMFYYNGQDNMPIMQPQKYQHQISRQINAVLILKTTTTTTVTANRCVDVFVILCINCFCADSAGFVDCLSGCNVIWLAVRMWVY